MSARDQAGLLSQPTRARLYAALRELRRAATTEELASALGLHVNGVRRHLERMRVAGLLDRRRAPHGRGRPRDEWSLTTDARPAGEPAGAYHDLAGWLARATPAGPTRLRQLERSGREIGRELAPDPGRDLAQDFNDVLAALGFEPRVRVEEEGRLTCTLCNCPYRDAVRENPEAICTLHRGVTRGLLDRLDPAARLSGFDPRDPGRAGCTLEVTAAGIAADHTAG